MKTYPVSENETTLLLQEPQGVYATSFNERKNLRNKFLFSSFDRASATTAYSTYQYPYYFFDSSTLVHADSDVEILQKAFYFVNPIEIKHFLIQHPEIIDSLMQCYEEVLKRFAVINPKMELVSDMELPDWKTLFIRIPIGTEYERIFEQVNDLLQNWVFYQPKSFKQLVTITMG